MKITMKFSGFDRGGGIGDRDKNRPRTLLFLKKTMTMRV